MKNILFITPNSFKYNNGGSVLFNELLKLLPKIKIFWFICTERLSTTVIKFNFQKTFYYDSRLFTNYYLNTIARKFPLFGIPFYYIHYKINSYFAFRIVERIIKENKIELIWTYLSQSSIPVSKYIYRKLKIPYHLSIQDDIYTHLPPFEAKILKKDFKYIIENANSIDFISNEMSDYYHSIYNIKAQHTVLIISNQVEVGNPQINKKISKIGYAGNIWCGENFEIFLDGLTEFNLRYGEDIKLHVYSNHKPKMLSQKFKDLLIYHRFLDYNDLIKELQNYDFLYLPMSFDPSKKITNITSFPSKIITYLNTKVPIINHSPIEAVSHKFVVHYNLGYSLSIGTKTEVLQFFLEKTKSNDKIKRIEFSENAESTLKLFNNNEMARNFLNLIK